MKTNLMKYLTNLFFATHMMFVVDGDAGGGEAPADDNDSAGETNPDDAGNEGDDSDPTPAAEGDDAVPETYADFTMPEGMEVDTAALEHYAPILKDIGLNQEQAQKLVTAQAGLIKARDEQAATDYQSTVDGWANEVKADKELGGDNYDATIQQAAVALDKLGDEGLSSFLDTYGIGSNPHMVRFFAKVGAMVNEDNPVNGGQPPAGKPKSQVEIMYPTK